MNSERFNPEPKIEASQKLKQLFERLQTEDPELLGKWLFPTAFFNIHRTSDPKKVAAALDYGVSQGLAEKDESGRYLIKKIIKNI